MPVSHHFPITMPDCSYAVSVWASILTNSVGRVIPEKLTVPQLIKAYPERYIKLEDSITMFRTACHLSVPWATYFQSTTSHPRPWRSILILPLNLHLVFQMASACKVFGSKFCMPPINLSHTCQTVNSTSCFETGCTIYTVQKVQLPGKEFFTKTVT